MLSPCSPTFDVHSSVFPISSMKSKCIYDEIKQPWRPSSRCIRHKATASVIPRLTRNPAPSNTAKRWNQEQSDSTSERVETKRTVSLPGSQARAQSKQQVLSIQVNLNSKRYISSLRACRGAPRLFVPIRYVSNATGCRVWARHDETAVYLKKLSGYRDSKVPYALRFGL